MKTKDTRIIHKTCPTWGLTECGKSLLGRIVTTTRWANTTCPRCLESRPSKTSKTHTQ
jgi:DNA-binding HxlR family transcriptional regulator